ncbi:unnamed protein product, partial [Musa banksii]
TLSFLSPWIPESTARTLRPAPAAAASSAAPRLAAYVCLMEQLEKMRPPSAAAESDAGSRKVAALPSSSYPGEEPPKAADRCGKCKKKVRLCARFECRCGSTFCAAHRLPETHECAFDYKAHGRAAIAEANPVVVKDKLRRI